MTNTALYKKIQLTADVTGLMNAEQAHRSEELTEELAAIMRQLANLYPAKPEDKLDPRNEGKIRALIDNMFRIRGQIHTILDQLTCIPGPVQEALDRLSLARAIEASGPQE